jgi:CDP-paratose 2-epimerase
MSLRNLSEWCAQRFGPMEILKDIENRTFDIPWMVLDHAQATNCWDWAPTTSIYEILEEIADHAENNPSWLSISCQ